MLKDVRTGTIQALIFSKLARFARNTRELLEFSDHFQECKADLVSIDESIDTSSPAGRFFYTLIASMAQWEREEISARIKASVPIRAKMGKIIGGQAPFGYKKEDDGFVLNEEEAPIRKRMFELFREVKRKRTVAMMLNDEGHRTRKGKMWSDTTVGRLLRDPLSKGMRRANYTQSKGEGKAWEFKPKSDWVFIEAPAIVSKELWTECNDILDAMRNSRSKVRKRSIHLFSGILYCHCGNKMYYRTKSPVYFCRECKNKIQPDALQDIFQDELNRYLLSDSEIQKVLQQQEDSTIDKKHLIETTKQEIHTLQQEIDKLLSLYQSDKLTPDAFEKYHTPKYEQLQQKEHFIKTLQAELDLSLTDNLSTQQVVYEANNLSRNWNSFSKQDQRIIIQEITDSITIGTDTVNISLKALPTLPSVETQATLVGFPTMSLLFKLVALCNATT